MENTNTLFHDFPPISTAQWKEQIMKDLKGADYDKKLVWKSIEGFDIQPFYRSEHLEQLPYLDAAPNEYPFIRGYKTKNNDWEIRQDIEVTNIDDANKKALDVLMKGATSLGFVFKGQIFDSQKDFSRLLRGIHLEAISLNFVGLNASDYLSMLYNEVEAQKLDPLQVCGSVEFDPMSYLSITGGCIERSPDISLEKLRAMLQFSIDKLPNIRVLCINGKNFGNSGGSISQELGLTIGMAADYLAKITDSGISAADMAPRIQFNFGVGSNYFAEIARLRAARILYTKLIEAYDAQAVHDARVFLHCETSCWNKAIYDPYVNMLRTTTEAMSATLGGADSLTVLPFDMHWRKPNEFSERIARNTQSVLKDEAYFDKIVDPGAGSYYIEKLTNSFVEHAWKLFLEIEEEGGYFASLRKGKVQARIKEMAQKRDMNIAMRKEILLGTNQYPNIDENLADLSFSASCCPMPITPANALVKPLKRYRGAMAFEQMRLKTDKHSKRPVVFLLTIGNLAMRKARAGFAYSFMGCAGFKVIDNIGFDSVAEGVEAARAKNADIIVLCSSDEEYMTLAPRAQAACKDKEILVIAGNPKERQKLESQGIGKFIHVRSNVLETLAGYQSLLGIV